jgi:DNA repair protein REV1
MDDSWEQDAELFDEIHGHENTEQHVVNIPPANVLKRPRSPSAPSSSWDKNSRNNVASTEQTADYTNSEVYGASRFGHLGEYMRRKRAKLQIQNTVMEGVAVGNTERSRLFEGIAIYVSLCGTS